MDFIDFNEDEVYSSGIPAATTNTLTVSGINTSISVRLLAAGTLPSGMSITARRNGSSVGTISGSSQWVDFTVNNGDTVSFSATCTPLNTWFQMDTNFRNLTNGNTVIDPTITFRVRRNSGPAP
jgi:hypothetical protein